MMKIACIGWGSLIWAPGDLPIRSGWFQDGPFLPIELARESKGRRITLVIAEVPHSVRTLWALMTENSLTEAKLALARREGISDEYVKRSIGYWDSVSNSSHGECAAEISAWAGALRLDAVVWTNLKVGLAKERGTLPSYDQVLKHLSSLRHQERRVAEEYIRKAPLQIDTEYRRNLERDLGWSPI